MHPTLFRIGGFQITTYGLMLAIAFAVASTLIVRRGEREGIPGDFLQNLLVWIMIAALVGSRLLHVYVYWDYFRTHPAEIVFSREGYVFLGGFVAAFGVAVYLILRNGQNIWKIGDLLVPYLALAQGIGRLGCFGFGCCFGRPTSVPWAVRFPRTVDPSGLLDGSPAYLHHLSQGWIGPEATHSLPVHPSQLYSSALGWCAFLFLLYLRRRGHRPGELMLSYILIYSIGRFLVEWTRGDPRGEFLHILSTSQAGAVALFAAGLGTLIWRRLQLRRG
ncbi:MAG: prolipoprotein diacylglyceryl transferase [bacterium]